MRACTARLRAASAVAPAQRRLQPEPLVQRLEPVGELELVALGAAEELDPPRALRGGRLDRVERRDLARGPAGEQRVERQLVEVHAVPEQEVVVAGHRLAVDPQQPDPRDAQRRQRHQRGAVELLPDRGREARRLRQVAPARLVQLERLLERRGELLQIARDLERDLAELRQLLAAAPVQVAALPRRLGAVHLVPSGLEVEHGRLRARDQPEALGAGGRGEPAGLRQPEQVGEVGAGAGRTLDEQLHGRRMGAVRHQDVGERGGVLAEEARDPQPAPVLDEQRQGAREPVSLARDVDGEAVPAGVVAPPLEQPAVQQERARPRHRRHQRVPLGPESGELARVGDGGDRRDHAASSR